MQNRKTSMIYTGSACVLMIILLSTACSKTTDLIKNPSRNAGAFVTGKYRNLFVEIGYSPEEVAAKINAAFKQLFHGDPNTQAVYFPAGTNANGPMAYIYDINSKDVRSEGMSYGMMIAVQLDKKAELDAIWNWARTYMYHDDPKHPGYI